MILMLLILMELVVQTSNQTLEGNYEGVGIEVTHDNSKVKITKVFADTPAKKSRY